MEAATPLRKPHVRSVSGRVAIDGLVVDDECAARLVRDREEAGEDPAKLVMDAIEIGARVLDREQTGANADFVKAEFHNAYRQLEAAFAERAGATAEQLAAKVDEVFSADTGQLSKTLRHHFSDDSSAAVQNRVQQILLEREAKLRESLMKLLSGGDGTNPFADFKAGMQDALKRADERQDTNLRALFGKLGELEKEVQGLRDERQKHEELDAERERGTAKGRDFEEVVAGVLEEISRARGDDCDAVGDVKGATRKTGDVVVAIDACNGPARGRIVFEAKNRRLSKNAALAELDRARTERNADFAVLVVSSDDQVPAKLHELREYNGDKLVVAWDPESDSWLPLEVAYSLARARVLMTRSDGDGVDAEAVRNAVERALQSMDGLRAIKLKLTGARTGIDEAGTLIDALAAQVREQLLQVEALLASADDG